MNERSTDRRRWTRAARLLGVLFGLATLILVWAVPLQPRAQGRSAPIRGIWYNSFNNLDYLNAALPKELNQLKQRLCPNYIQLVVHAFQNGKTSSDPHLDSARSISDEALKRLIDEVHKQGMRAALLISLFVDDGTWQGAILPQNLNSWFNEWKRLVSHYAELGQEVGLDIL